MNKSLLQFAKAIGEEKRINILRLLKKQCCVEEIWKKLGLPQNLVSHHLQVLKRAGLIMPEKRGLKVVYRRDEKRIKADYERLGKYLSAGKR